MTSLEGKDKVMLNNSVGNKICGLICAATMLAGFGAAQASAQTADERTFFTFSGPVELPGVALAPGTYMFRLPSSNTTHDLVQVLSADGHTAYGMFLTLPIQRETLPDQPDLRFMETTPGAPAAITAWWYPGDSTGFEFIYPT